MANANNLKYDFCAFCGEPDPISKEHVLPAWVWEAAKIAGIKTTELAYYDESNVHLGWPTITRPGDGTIPIMCHDCNTRWGSKLQAASKPTLLPFIVGGWTSLDQNQKKIIARWFTNHIMVRELVHPYLGAYTQQHRESFKEHNRIPHKLNIWVARITNPGFYSFHRSWKDPKYPNASYNQTHITAQEVGNILLVGFGSPNDGHYGVNSFSYMAVQNIMKSFGFVPLLASNKKYEVAFPDMYPHSISYEDLSQVIAEITHHLFKPFENWDYTTLLCQPHTCDI